MTGLTVCVGGGAGDGEFGGGGEVHEAWLKIEKKLAVENDVSKSLVQMRRRNRGDPMPQLFWDYSV